MAPIRKKVAKARAKASTTSNPSTVARPTSRLSNSGTASSTRSFPSSTSASATSSAFAPTKRDKRQIKHSRLLSRISKSSSSSSTTTRRARRRKEKASTQQLSTSLASLLDTLPSSSQQQSRDYDHSIQEANADAHTQNATLSSLAASASANAPTVREALRGARSLKSRAGLQKRRAGVASAERERFARNLAVMARGGAQDQSQHQEAKDEGEVGTMENVDGAAEVGAANNATEQSGGGGRSERWAALRRHIELSMGASNAPPTPS